MGQVSVRKDFFLSRVDVKRRLSRMSKPNDESRPSAELEPEKSLPNLPAIAERPAPLATSDPIEFGQLPVVKKIKAFARYYRLVINRTAKETFKSLDLTWLGTFKKLLFYLLVVVVTAWLSPKGLEKEVPGKLIWLAAFVASALMYLAWNLIRAPYLIYQDSVSREKEIRDENGELRRELEPKLRIFFDKTNSNCVDLNYVPPSGQDRVISQYRVFRVGIKNIGGCGVYGIEVKADYEWEGRSFSAIPLHQMHDLHWLDHGMHLGCGEDLYVDVVMMKERAHDAKFSAKLSEIRLCHIKQAIVPSGLGRERHRIPIVAYSSEAPPERSTFIAWVDEWDRLQFEEEMA